MACRHRRTAVGRTLAGNSARWACMGLSGIGVFSQPTIILFIQVSFNEHRNWVENPSVKIIFLGTGVLGLLTASTPTGWAESDASSGAVGAHALTSPSYAVRQRAGTLGHHHHDESTENPFEFELMLGAESRYVSEGRDNLPDSSGVLWGNMVGHAHALSGSIYAEILGIEGMGADYTEMGLTLGYERELGSVTGRAELSLLEFPGLGENELESALSADWKIDSQASLAAEWVWSGASEGWYAEASARYEVKVEDNFILMASLLTGFNGGYLPDESHGLTHIGLRLEATVGLSEHVKGVIHTTFVRPIEHADDPDLEDLIWAGGALVLTF